jgi:hypothetical protein
MAGQFSVTHDSESEKPNTPDVVILVLRHGGDAEGDVWLRLKGRWLY